MKAAMIGFKTKNSEYYVDQVNNAITGGIFKDKWYKYVQLSAIVGARGYIVLVGGKVVTTGIIEKYLTV